MKLRYKISLAVASYIICYKFLGSIYDLRAICESGWRSPKIGIQGACSWHGGVDNSAASAAFLVSMIVSVLTYNIQRIANAIKDDVSSFPFKKSQSPIVQKESLKTKIVIQPVEIHAPKITLPPIEQVIKENKKYALLSKQFIDSQMEIFEKKEALNKRRKRRK